MLLIALLPPIILIIYIWKLDTIEKEPGSLLLKLFIFGVLTTVGAMILESVGEWILNSFVSEPTSSLYMLIDNFIVVAWAEEGLKRLALRRCSFRHPAFDYRFDGIVYAVMVSLGFAAAENVLYVFQYGLFTGLIRAVTAIPLHCITGIYMGHYYGEAKSAHVRGNLGRYRRFMRLSLVIPILIHGFYDFCASTDSGLLMLLFIAFVVIIDIFAFLAVRRYSREDSPV